MFRGWLFLKKLTYNHDNLASPVRQCSGADYKQLSKVDEAGHLTLISI